MTCTASRYNQKRIHSSPTLLQFINRTFLHFPHATCRPLYVYFNLNPESLNSSISSTLPSKWRVAFIKSAPQVAQIKLENQRRHATPTELNSETLKSKFRTNPLQDDDHGSAKRNRAVVVVKWSAWSPSSTTIRVRIQLKSSVLFFKLFEKNEKRRTKISRRFQSNSDGLLMDLHGLMGPNGLSGHLISKEGSTSTKGPGMNYLEKCLLILLLSNSPTKNSVYFLQLSTYCHRYLLTIAI